jgi:hypothetical protein
VSPEKRLLYGYTDAEAAEILKKESPEHKAQQEREGREQGGLRSDRFKRKVRREQQREAVQRAADAETIAKMTPAQYDEFRRKRDSTPARPPGDTAGLGDGCGRQPPGRRTGRQPCA